MSARMILDSVRRRQAEASDPLAAVFVSANAGSGKTHVLAQRVIRLMLDGGPAGVDPSKILCITFTKAAAANMAARVYDRLKSWIALDDDALDRAMQEIGVTEINAAKRLRARRLFAAALETPGGLKMQTIHAFCTRVLQQFPFEADVAAHFSVLEERIQNEMLERARMAVLLEAAAAPEKSLGRAFKVAVAGAADTTLVDTLNEAIAQRQKVAAWIDGGVERAIAQLSMALGIDADDDLAHVEKDIVEGPHLPLSHWADIVAALEEGSKNDHDQAWRLSAALAASGEARIEHYFSIFLKEGNERRKKLITVGLADRYPELAERLGVEQDRVIELVARRNGVICRDRTVALVTIAVEVIKRYSDEKQRRGLLDYEDLIDKTQRLLAEFNPNWVHYKLDLGLDHVLIDEAQDTSENQWGIIKRLVSEFGIGTNGGFARTVFAVGDEKQSIFSFQGAAPCEYDAARRHFEQIFLASGVAWRFVRFDHSFRSGENVLGAVDEVFRLPQIYRSITSDRDGKPVHLALPDAAPGVVEIWPLIEPDPIPEIEGWDAPFDAVSERSPQVKLASKIAATVRGWVDGGEPVGRDGRPIQYGDVLILVRQRGALFGGIIRALKNAGVAVAGADRLVLTEHIAIIDLLALADAVLLEDDDLALAIALKSPLFGFDDDLLFELAWPRRGSLRAALAARAGDKVEFAGAEALLRQCSARARYESPFAFFAWLLGPEAGRRKIFARLGLEAADALDEFLELALEYERHEAPSLQGFVAWLRGATTVVKRDMEITRDEVRVMTVHGAKGLEAPVVILADTTTPPKGVHQPKLLEIKPPSYSPPPAGESRKGVPGEPACIVWAGRRDQDVRAVAQARQAVMDENEHEHRRLLYVAMTRAAERLIVCGCHGKMKPKSGCWYDLVRSGLAGRPGFEEVGEGDTKVWRYSRAGEAPQQMAHVRSPKRERTIEVPAWLTTPAAPEIDRPVAMSPSAASGEAATRRARSPRREPAQALAQAKALARGTLFHRMMQSLPDIEPARREAAAWNFLARTGAMFSADDRNRFVKQAFAILADRRFAQLFEPGSRAEVPIVGRLARAAGPEILVSGQIDRLAITAHAVLIADYKTNHDPPKSLQAAPQAYVEQLALYRAVLGRIYPDRPIRAALLWTEIPDLMEISAAMLDEAVARITSR
ncbi:MAG TPA: double-strand break repair helicase AddA [Xanthobacteraceae bacterium]|nr:double-strand break repair helicase AddA [Xanthobacteraceae bacterium]